MYRSSETCTAPIAGYVTEGAAFGGSILYRAERTMRAAESDGVLAIRLADNAGERSTASMVVNRCYGRRGYGANHALASGPRVVTFTASSRQMMFGTITLTADGDEGLPVDSTFPSEIAALRREADTVVCELGKFAFDPSPDSRPFLASLFHIVYLYGTEHFQGTDLVIEVNPRHVLFYRTMLGFAKIGALKTNSSVDAPSQLMHIKVANIGAKIAECAKNGTATGRSLYPHFFSLSEEAGLRKRIKQLRAEPDREGAIAA